jgi:uncharacterized protein YecT (DUF1311 family)
MQGQREEDECEGRASDVTERHFAAFASALEGIIGAAALHDSEQAWMAYRAKQCDAIADFFRGSIARSARSRCFISLTRSHMRDLDELYETPLHH